MSSVSQAQFPCDEHALDLGGAFAYFNLELDALVVPDGVAERWPLARMSRR
jgi:hypothetical protein